MLYRFDDFELDAENFVLRRGGTACHIEPLVFDLLLHLARNPERVLGKDEIIEAVWNGRIVSDATVASCIKAARKALGDSGGSQTYIRTIRGRGIQFLGQISTGEAPRTLAENTAKTGPSLGILPFQVFGDEAGLRPLADGLVESLTTVLTRVPLLSLASRTSSFALRGENLEAREAGRRLGVRFVLEGSLQPVSGGLRANVQLIETRNGFHLWAQQFDRPTDPGATEDLLRDILPRLEMQLVRAIHDDLKGADGELSGGQLLLQAMGLLAVKGWHRNTFEEATRLLRQAIDRAPDLALAHAQLALILGLGHRVGLLEQTTALAGEVVAIAERALDLDNLDSNVVGLAACALADIGQPERAVPLLNRALELNPNNAQAWTAIGSAKALLGRPEEAIDALTRGIGISPMDSRLAVWRAILALAYLQAGDLDGALDAAESGRDSDDRTYLPRLALTAVHLARREREQAVRALRDCLRVKPDLSRAEIDGLVGAKLGGLVARLQQRTVEN